MLFAIINLLVIEYNMLSLLASDLETMGLGCFAKELLCKFAKKVAPAQ